MFENNKIKQIEERIEQRSENLNEVVNKINSRLNKIEEIINPPTFEVGDIVNFFLVDNEFIGEIVRENVVIEQYLFFPSYKKDGRWVVKYLDANNVSQEVAVKEEDIWVDDGCLINERFDGIYDELDLLRSEIKTLKGKK